MLSKSKIRWARLYTDVNRNRFIRVKFSDAKKPVDAWIKFSDELVADAKKGKPFECVLAMGTMQAVAENPNLFPHPVLYAHFLPRTVYLVDKVNGQPIHAIRYQHDFSHLTYAFDKITKAEFTKRFGKGGLKLHLRPVKNKGGAEPEGARETRERKDRDPNTVNRVSRGAQRRAEDAGFAIPEIKPKVKKKEEEPA